MESSIDNYHERVCPSLGARLASTLLAPGAFCWVVVLISSATFDMQPNYFVIFLLYTVMAYASYFFLTYIYCLKIVVKPMRLTNGGSQSVLRIFEIRRPVWRHEIPLKRIHSVKKAEYDEHLWSSLTGGTGEGVSFIAQVPGYRGTGLLITFDHKNRRGETIRKVLQIPTSSPDRLSQILEGHTASSGIDPSLPAS